ncbi:sarcosine oxidase subunit gamma [Actinomycetospora chlora]|uniref:Sarcosine oxidase subunit gamma n=1 Tax=Actinomycetospora chlora TaxID=663608 RepID=A0ABP9AV25_9PSEU
MADTLPITHPLESRRELLASVTGPVRLELDDPVAAADLRIDPSGVDAVADAAGGALPMRPESWTPLPDGLAVRLGPDEWLLASATARPDEWERRLDAAAAPAGGTAVDVSAQRTSVRLRGPGARALLAAGCAIDLRPASFPRGRSAQTLLGQAPVLLVAHADDDLQVLVRPSFAGAVVDLLVDATQA